MAKTILVILLLILGLFSPPCDTLETVNSTENAIVDLLIICDWKFATEFQNDRNAIGSFLYAHILDLNNRLRTLQKTKIQVRVVDFVKLRENQLSSGDSKYGKFAKWSGWLYENQSRFPKFDLAIVVTGENTATTKVWALSGRMCDVDNLSRQFRSMVLIQSNRGDPNLPEFLADTIVEAIAPLGSMTKLISCQNVKRSLMGGTFSRERFFYSECADDAIFTRLQENKSQCILNHDSNATDALAQYSSVARITLDDTCKSRDKIHKQIDARIEPDSCVTTKCYLTLRDISFIDSNRVMTQIGLISPVDNTECDTNSFCFKGLCLPRGLQIKNVNQQICMSSNNWFATDDKASTIDCKSSGTPMETLTIDQEKSGKRLMKAYGVPYSVGIFYKCLTVDKDTHQAYFIKCHDEGAKTWHLVRAKPKRNVFMLFHADSHACVFINEMQEVKASPLCDATNLNYLFEFVEDGSVSKKSIESLLQNGIGLNTSQEFCFSSWLRGVVG